MHTTEAHRYSSSSRWRARSRVGGIAGRIPLSRREVELTNGNFRQIYHLVWLNSTGPLASVAITSRPAPYGYPGAKRHDRRARSASTTQPRKSATHLARSDTAVEGIRFAKYGGARGDWAPARSSE